MHIQGMSDNAFKQKNDQKKQYYYSKRKSQFASRTQQKRLLCLSKKVNDCKCCTTAGSRSDIPECRE